MTKTRVRQTILLLAVIGLVSALPGCAPSDPVERLADTRSRYSARLNGFYVKAEPVVDETALAADEDAVVAETDAATGDETEAVEEVVAVPLRQDALLDIIVQHDSATKLEGITLDIVMADPSGAVKDRWLYWVDTSKLEKANQLQLTHVLEDVPYVEGDGFSVEVRHPIPAEERGEYAEFSVGE